MWTIFSQAVQGFPTTVQQDLKLYCNFCYRVIIAQTEGTKRNCFIRKIIIVYHNISRIIRSKQY